jgi:peptidyl-prolyl cis-trans isomerase D
MFDLFRSRAKSVRIMLGAILLFVAAAMVITLIPGFGGADFGVSAQSLGEVAGEPITINQIRTAVQRLSQGTDMNPQQMSSMFPVAFRNLVQERALLYEADRLGFNVGDEDLIAAIRSIPAFSRNGQFIGLEEYRLLLEQNGTTPAQFEANLRKEIISNRLSAMVSRTVVVTDEEIDNALRERHETASLEYLYIDPDTLMNQVTPSEQEVEAFYALAENKVRIPEKRDFDVVRVSMERAMQASPVPMSEIQAYYDANMEQWRLDEQVKLRHILLSTDGRSPEEREAQRQKATELLGQIRGGADFARLARENSDDQSNASQGGDLGWIFRGQTEPAFEQVAFNLEPGQVGDLVETSYGFHIVKSEGKEPAKVLPLEQVRDRIAGGLAQQRAADTVQRVAERLRSEAMANPERLKEVVEAEPIAQLVSYSAIPNNAPVGSISGSLPLRQEMNELEEGRITSVGDAGGNSLAFAVVKGVQPDRDATREEAMDTILRVLKGRKAATLAERRLAEAKEAVESGASMRVVGRNMGLTYGEAPPFTRLSAAEGIGNAGEVYQAFDVPAGTVIGPFRSAARMFLARVTEKEEANLAELATERDEIRKQLGAVKAQERLQLYLEGVQARLEREGKIKIDSQRVAAMMRGGVGI